MEKKTILTGASDDLIILKGELFEEFSSYDCSKGTLAFSDGTLLTVKYDEYGLWRFGVLFKGSSFLKLIPGDISEDTNDEIHFSEGLKWCVFSDKMQVGHNKSFNLI